MILKVVKKLFKYQFSDLLSVMPVDLFSPALIFHASSAVYVSDNAAIWGLCVSMGQCYSHKTCGGSAN